jgi:hypothetical protein
MTSLLRKFTLKIRYPKMILLAVSIFAGYLIYTDENNFHFHALIDRFGYLSIFVAGLFFAHGFTLGPSIAALLLIGEKEPLLMSALVATAGALIGNGIVHQHIRISFEEEYDDIANRQLFIWAKKSLSHHTPAFVRKYIFPAFAGILVSTPLPDEFSAALVHASKNMSVTVFSFVSFIFSAFGVSIILALGKWL